MQTEVLCVIMYLSVQDNDSKRAFILVDMHSLNGGPYRKYYKITSSGTVAYNQMRQEWDGFSYVVDMLLKGVDYNE